LKPHDLTNDLIGYPLISNEFHEIQEILH
jgi:hypothetical protein